MRIQRVTPPGTFQHIISRFVDRRPRLITDEYRAAYLACAARGLARTDWRPVAFALMSTHVHWVARAGYNPSARFIQSAHSAFAAWLRRRENTLGPIFAQRHSTYTVGPARIARLVAYVHNNPVRAGLIHEASASTWTSHRFLTGEAAAPAWLDVEWSLACCGFDATAAGREAFAAYVRTCADDPRDTWRSEAQTGRVRALARKVCTGAELASGIEDDDGSAFHPLVRPVRIGDLRRWPMAVEAVVEVVAARFGLDVETVLGRTRTARIIAARMMALFVWTELLGGTQSVVRRALGISASRASELCASARNATPEWRRAAEDLVETLVCAGASYTFPAEEVAIRTE